MNEEVKLDLFDDNWTEINIPNIGQKVHKWKNLDEDSNEVSKNHKKKVFIMTHGFSEYGTRHVIFDRIWKEDERVIPVISDENIDVIVYDLRGHYREMEDGTIGKKYNYIWILLTSSDVRKFSDYTDDLGTLVNYFKGDERVEEIFIFAHSLGSCITRRYLEDLEIEENEKLKGVILSGSGIYPGGSDISRRFYYFFGIFCWEYFYSSFCYWTIWLLFAMYILLLILFPLVCICLLPLLLLFIPFILFACCSMCTCPPVGFRYLDRTVAPERLANENELLFQITGKHNRFPTFRFYGQFLMANSSKNIKKQKERIKLLCSKGLKFMMFYGGNDQVYAGGEYFINEKMNEAENFTGRVLKNFQHEVLNENRKNLLEERRKILYEIKGFVSGEMYIKEKEKDGEVKINEEKKDESNEEEEGESEDNSGSESGSGSESEKEEDESSEDEIKI